MSKSKTPQQILGLMGIVSLLSYAAAVVFSPMAYPGYQWMAQAVSDLSADAAPSRGLWNQLSALYLPAAWCAAPWPAWEYAAKAIAPCAWG